MSGTVLIFPFGPPGSLEALARLRGEGRVVVCASSLGWDPGRVFAPAWESIPYFNAPDFAPRLQAVIAAHGVEEIFCPHAVVLRHLAAVLPDLAPGVRLADSQAWQAEFIPFRVAEMLADRFLADPALPAAQGPLAPPLSRAQASALFAQAGRIPGWCNNEKIAAFLDVFRCMPQGDVVEIGTWCGKSASVLALLAGHYGIGPLLCLDPWRTEEVVQADTTINTVMTRFDLDEVFRIFVASLTLITGGAAGRVNYVREPSEQAGRRLSGAFTVTTPEFGATAYSGALALLHIDGNHDRDKVQSDLDLWGSRVRPGGWLVFDDYVHAWGDAPRQVADAFLTREAGRIACAFVANSALFVQLACG